MSERYGNEIPSWLRFLKCFAIQGDTYRFSWGEFTPKPGFSIGYTVYHDEAHWHIHPLWGNLFIDAPMLINQRQGTEDWDATFGIGWHSGGFWWHWRTKFWVWRPYGEWQHVRHDVKLADGSLAPFVGSWENKKPDNRYTETHDYTYTLKNGTVQNRKATVFIEEREWRWRVFGLTLPYPRMVRRSLDVSFDDEVGEGTGSWKGGTVGCGYDLRRGESMLSCLRRMEQERKFN